MVADPTLTRRLLLGQGCSAAFLLPAGLGAQAAVHHAPKAQGQMPLVVIDPGHGGKDPGAIGVRGTYEKHVAFETATELARQLGASGRCRVALTRERDIFVPLPDRVGIAEQHGAALFVSLHADAVLDHRVRGASVYTLSASASDAQSAALAESQNAVDSRYAPPGMQVAPHIGAILASLVRHETRIGSARLQRQAVSSLAGSESLLQNPARQAGFAVLKAASIPSILVEMGFMSNPEDEAALCTQGHRAVIAAAMRQAIEHFLIASRQRGTML